MPAVSVDFDAVGNEPGHAADRKAHLYVIGDTTDRLWHDGFCNDMLTSTERCPYRCAVPEPAALPGNVVPYMCDDPASDTCAAEIAAVDRCCESKWMPNGAKAYQCCVTTAQATTATACRPRRYATGGGTAGFLHVLGAAPEGVLGDCTLARGIPPIRLRSGRSIVRRRTPRATGSRAVSGRSSLEPEGRRATPTDRHVHQSNAQETWNAADARLVLARLASARRRRRNVFASKSEEDAFVASYADGLRAAIRQVRNILDEENVGEKKEWESGPVEELPMAGDNARSPPSATSPVPGGGPNPAPAARPQRIPARARTWIRYPRPANPSCSCPRRIRRCPKRARRAPSSRRTAYRPSSSARRMPPWTRRPGTSSAAPWASARRGSRLRRGGQRRRRRRARAANAAARRFAGRHTHRAHAIQREHGVRHGHQGGEDRAQPRRGCGCHAARVRQRGEGGAGEARGSHVGTRGDEDDEGADASAAAGGVRIPARAERRRPAPRRRSSGSDCVVLRTADAKEAGPSLLGVPSSMRESVERLRRRLNDATAGVGEEMNVPVYRWDERNEGRAYRGWGSTWRTGITRRSRRPWRT